jgi:hypothetical protein
VLILATALYVLSLAITVSVESGYGCLLSLVTAVCVLSLATAVCELSQATAVCVLSLATAVCVLSTYSCVCIARLQIHIQVSYREFRH